MDPITWVANLYGPIFLVLYAIVSILAITLCAIWSRRCDPLPGFGPALPKPTASSDPYEFAWLRDGNTGMLSTALYALRKASLITITNDDIRRTPIAAEIHHPAERAVYGALATPRKRAELISDSALLGQFDHISATYRAKFEQAGLVTNASERARAITATLTAVGIILGLGGFKLFAALSHGRHNVVFLILLGIVATIVAIVACRPKHLNARGRAYLKSLKEKFSSFAPTPSLLGPADVMPLYVGLLGTGILVGTGYDDVNKVFRYTSSGSSSCSGGSCGGGCSSGSSCSGGGGCGGGCGGGGCGGCGG